MGGPEELQATARPKALFNGTHVLDRMSTQGNATRRSPIRWPRLRLSPTMSARRPRARLHLALSVAGLIMLTASHASGQTPSPAPFQGSYSPWGGQLMNDATPPASGLLRARPAPAK